MVKDWYVNGMWMTLIPSFITAHNPIAWKTYRSTYGATRHFTAFQLVKKL